METNLLDRMLSTYQDGQLPVTVTLQNKIRITGKIKAFDSYVIVMEGSKREILYRHAISSLTQQAPIEQKRQPVVSRPAAAKPAPPNPKPVRTTSHKPTRKPRAAQPQTLSASAGEPGLNTGMQDGLLKWMQEQKAAK